MNDWYRWRNGALILDIHVQPRASRDEIAGVHGDRLKIRITAPPVDGKANRHLIAYLAKVFGVPKSDVTIVAGESGRDKRAQINDPKRFPDILGNASVMD
ncbi:MAG: protein Mettu [Proteobacteria bacterium]|nr:protein Mettu [Pseudomonadota bacterium]